MAFDDDVERFRTVAEHADRQRRSEGHSVARPGEPGTLPQRAAALVAEARRSLVAASVPPRRLYHRTGGLFSHRFLPYRGWPLASLVVTDERTPRLVPWYADRLGEAPPGRRFRDHVRVFGPQPWEVWIGTVVDWRTDKVRNGQRRIGSSIDWTKQTPREPSPGEPLIVAQSVPGGWEEPNHYLKVPLRDWLAAEVAAVRARAR